MFTPINTPHHHHQHRIAIIARPTTETRRLPGHGAELHITALSEDGHRFQFAKAAANGVYAYGDGVVLEVWQRGATFYLTTVSTTGPEVVTVTYTMGNS